MKPIVKVEDSVGRIVLLGQFDFTTHKEFRGACQELLDEDGLSSIEVDFAEVPYLDSSALGMLLLLKEKAAHKGKSLALINCRESVRQVLDVACFNKLFTIR